MRILQLHTRYRQPGGEDAVVASHRELLESRGNIVSTLLADNPGGPVASVAALAVAPFNPGWMLRARRAIREFDPDVVHVHNTWYAMSPAVVRVLQSVPAVMTLHNYRLMCANAMLFRDGEPCELCVGSHPWHAVRYGCYRGSPLVSVPAAATIAVNAGLHTWEAGIDLFLPLDDFGASRFAAGGLPRDRMEVVPNFVADPGARDSPASSSSEVLVVGRLSPEKGIVGFLDEWSRSAPRDLELSVIGDGPLRSAVESRARGAIRFLGRLRPEEVAERMLGARALAFPSRWYEGQPLVVLEALASGLPVIARGLGGLAEITGALGSGWCIGAGDWRDGWGTLVDDASVEEASLRARARYLDRHSPNRVAARLEGAYGRVRRRGAR